jgi:hypothetical protein
MLSNLYLSLHTKIIFSPNISKIRNKSTCVGSLLSPLARNNSLLVNQNKALINPESFLKTGKIEGRILESIFPLNFSPWFLTGFTDAEGNFDFMFIKNERALAKTGIKFRFRITANYRDVVILCAIRNYFGAGTISSIRKDTKVVTFEIGSIEVIKNIIIPFFDKYPLKGTKYYDYLTWKNCFLDFLENKDNLDSKLLLIERLKTSKENLNRKKKEFLTPLAHLLDIDLNYISGFWNGDGTTTLVIKPDSFHEGFGSARAILSQHINNLPLLEAIKTHLGIGQIYTNKEMANLTISAKTDLKNILIPLFKKHPFYGAHAISFLKWSYIINYLFELNKDRSIFNKENQYEIINHVRDIWQDNTTQIYTDFTLEAKELLKKYHKKYDL